MSKHYTPTDCYSQAQWIIELYAISQQAIKSECRDYAAQAKQAASNGQALILCPISGLSYAMPMQGISSSIPRLPLISLHPMLSATLPHRVEDSLSLPMLMGRIIYSLCNKGLIHCATLLPSLSSDSLHKAVKGRLLKAIPMLLAVCAVEDTTRLARLPRLSLSHSLAYEGANAIADAISTYGLRCYGMLYTNYAASADSSADSQDSLVAELDAMLTADERASSLASKREDAARRMAQAKAAKRIDSLTLVDCIDTVLHTMQGTHGGWSHGVHGTMLAKLANKESPLAPHWLGTLSNLLQTGYPDVSLVGYNNYSAYEYVMQALDLAILAHSQAMYELDLLSPDTNDLMLRTLQRYNMDKAQGATIKLDAMTATALAPKAIAKKLSTALEQAATVAQAKAATQSVQAIASGAPKLSLAERIAAIKTAKGL